MSERQPPSVRFQHGEVHDFHSAMAVYVAQQQYELILSLESRQYLTSKGIEEAKDAVGEAYRVAEIAKSIYHEEVDEALKRAAQKLRAHGDPQLAAIADAVERQGYSILAL